MLQAGSVLHDAQRRFGCLYRASSHNDLLAAFPSDFSNDNYNDNDGIRTVPRALWSDMLRGESILQCASRQHICLFRDFRDDDESGDATAARSSDFCDYFNGDFDDYLSSVRLRRPIVLSGRADVHDARREYRGVRCDSTEGDVQQLLRDVAGGHGDAG
jgi:hypothetical protein